MTLCEKEWWLGGTHVNCTVLLCSNQQHEGIPDLPICEPKIPSLVLGQKGRNFDRRPCLPSRSSPYVFAGYKKEKKNASLTSALFVVQLRNILSKIDARFLPPTWPSGLSPMPNMHLPDFGFSGEGVIARVREYPSFTPYIFFIYYESDTGVTLFRGQMTSAKAVEGGMTSSVPFLFILTEQNPETLLCTIFSFSPSTPSSRKAIPSMPCCRGDDGGWGNSRFRRRGKSGLHFVALLSK